MNPKTITTAKLQLSQIPSAEADVDDLIEFAHTFDAYQRWGSFERCAELANARDHASTDKLRSCLFFKARRWRHFGEEPGDESLQYWRTLVADIRKRIALIDALSPARLAAEIRQLPSDSPVPERTEGYNNYTTQKDHWLGWLNPAAGTGTYPRKTGKDATARAVYNRAASRGCCSGSSKRPVSRPNSLRRHERPRPGLRIVQASARRCAMPCRGMLSPRPSCHERDPMRPKPSIGRTSSSRPGRRQAVGCPPRGRAAAAQGDGSEPAPFDV